MAHTNADPLIICPEKLVHSQREQNDLNRLKKRTKSYESANLLACLRSVLFRIVYIHLRFASTLQAVLSELFLNQYFIFSERISNYSYFLLRKNRHPIFCKT